MQLFHLGLSPIHTCTHCSYGEEVGVYGKAGNGNGNGNGNRNGKLKWITEMETLARSVTGLLNLPILPLLVRTEAKRAYYLYLSLGQAFFLESV